MANLLSYALCSLADVKESLGITDNSKDNLIIRKINQATEMIERYTGRRFASTTYTDETYDVDGGGTINLRNYPVITFTSLSQRDSTQNIDSWDTIDSQNYFVDERAGILEFNYNIGRGWEQYKATYTAGYTTIPADLAEACATLAGYLASQNPATIDAKVVQEGQRRQEFFDATGSGEDASRAGMFSRLGLLGILDMYKTPIISGRP